MRRLYAITALLSIAVLLGTLGFFVISGRTGDRFALCRGGDITTGRAAIGGPFTLIDERGRTVTDAQVLTKPSLIYFGYTACTDVCPADAARNAEVADILAARGIAVQPIFISIDPAHDTPAQLRRFTQQISPRLIGLTGSPAQVRRVAQEYRVAFSVEPAAAGGPPQVSHQAYTYLMLPRRGFVELFGGEVPAQQMAARVGCFVKSP